MIYHLKQIFLPKYYLMIIGIALFFTELWLYDVQVCLTRVTTLA